MAETDHTTPEQLIPEDLQDQTLLDWLKALLKKAIKKMQEQNADKNDPDTKTAKNLLKNINKVTQKVAQDKAVAASRGEPEAEHPVDRALPEKVREYINDFNVGDFIEEHHEWMIPLVAEVVEGAISPELFLVYASSELVHRTGADKRVAKIIAGRIRDKLKVAAGKLAHSTDPQDREAVDQAASTAEHIEALAPGESPTPEPGRTEQPHSTESKSSTRSRKEKTATYTSPITGEEYEVVYDEIKLRSRLETGMSDEDFEWFTKLSNPESFAQYYADRVDQVMKKIQKDGSQLNEAQAQQVVSDEVTQFVMNALVTIYSPILDEEPKEFFEKQAQNAGTYNDNPFNAARTFSKMLNTLREKSSIETTKARREKRDTILDQKNYFRLDRKTSIIQDDSSGQLVERTLPTTQKSDVRIGEFAEYLREVFESGEDTIDYGHNFKLLTTLGPREGPRGEDPFFTQIAGLAKRFSADKIDITFRLPYNEVVQAAKQKFQSSYARLFVDYQWQKDPALLSRFLQSMPAAERRVKDELREQFKDQKVPDWALEWAFQTGRTMYFGLDFGFHEMVSYADPNLQYNGSESLTGLGFMRGYFDMWETAKMLNIRKGKILAGAVWMPYDINMGDVEYDHAEWRRVGEGRWKESFTMGQAAYAGSFLDGHRLFIDMGNITGAGGWGTNSGWRMRESYSTWLLPEFHGGTSLRLDIDGKYLHTTNDSDPQVGDLNTFVRSWKRVENIGIPIAENFFKKYVIDKVDRPKEERETNKPEFVAAVQRLGGFFFDRYFTDEKGNLTSMGEVLLREYPTREAFLQHVTDVLTGDDYEGTRPEALLSIMNKVSTVMTLEQMPAHFVMMEKQRMTEYGVTLLSEIQTAFLARVGGKGNETIAKDRTDKALANLVYTQEKLRIDASESMEKHAAQPNGSLYGDLNERQSTILGEQGNILTEKYIEDVLKERFGLSDEEAHTNTQVQDVLAVYRTIQDRVTAKVTMEGIRKNAALVELENKTDAESKKRFQAIKDKVDAGVIRSRAAWWAHALDKNYFGHSVTQPSVAMKFVNVSAAASDVVQRDAAQAANTSELLHKLSTELYGKLKEAAEIGSEKGAHEAYAPLEEWIGAYKGKIQDELGSEIAYEVAFRGAQIIDFFFKKDDAANRWWNYGPQKYYTEWKKRSISDALIDEGAPLMAWDHNDEWGWGHYLHSKGRLKRKPSKGIKRREIMQNSPMRKALGKLPVVGDRLKNKRVWVRDYANSFSYHDLQEWSNSGMGKVILYHGIPIAIGILIALGLITGKEGSKDIEIT